MNSNVVLLDKTRKIGKLLHNNSTGKVVFSDICSIMSDILRSNIFIVSRKGKVLGIGRCADVPPLQELITGQVGTFIDEDLNERLLSVLSTKENVSLVNMGFDQNQNADSIAIVSPIEIAGERLGTVFMYRERDSYDIDDIILCEYGTTVVSLEMLRAVTEENEEENRKIAVVKSAISTLSYSEMEAIVCIFDELHGKEGILVASKIADKEGITRSVIVNALRKFESAGVLESRSSGMKGTYIKVLNDAVYSEIDNIRKQLHGE
ncbi:MAG: GTP-sensing pleiotropic transcriptional regulator CodY [Lachnospiraceae bacterium]|jgi:transcriptional pleiotropic repressor|nr:GTP-sensing pleiotropic transcriptional regulator CodY [Lachnospiraceae bacterium]MCH4029342.1 GTP-sensing pleiotropic transcriptional regulator CodY [Lachnospiraceae bacterium]MCH4067807.1 GTP-sensing pleiotropic transcriptional regulator CodY [Lachnospiraceae bacterium]MCH4113831.1 GTP-sensing pleiotropic transcriptional regulator CodY [Lachnospiraceae bacterium]MCI1352664.1 GTP-sensing pleiotropic transcriptional regulator CodY [Lachnospiraceae bacterium]